jgi:galactokinase/mevalonate kinase-like predicted kinase
LMRGHVNPTSKCALLRACVVLLIDDVIAALSQGGGIEIACCSALPAGSGMGGSSVLASVVIQALASLLERDCSSEDLVYLVILSFVESKLPRC